MKQKYFAYDSKLKLLAKKLRQDMPYSEIKLWKELRDAGMMGYRFNRQKPIGKFITDFYCSRLGLVIEIDGISHDDDIQQMKDQIRQDHLQLRGLTVLRVSAMDVVKDLENVRRGIEHWILDYEDRFGVCQEALKRRSRPA